MNVFISWSGETSKHIALAWHAFLPCVIQAVQPFMSGHDIGAGERWANRIASELEKANHSIVCLTPDNLDSPWILFEAGAITKLIEQSRLFTFLYPPPPNGLNPSDVKFPLATFQARVADREGIRSIVDKINDGMGDRKLPIARLAHAFEKYIDDFEAAIKNAPPTKAPPPKRDVPELLEELIQLVRGTTASQKDTDSETNDVSTNSPDDDVISAAIAWLKTRFQDAQITTNGFGLVTPTIVVKDSAGKKIGVECIIPHVSSTILTHRVNRLLEEKIIQEFDQFIVCIVAPSRRIATQVFEKCRFHLTRTVPMNIFIVHFDGDHFIEIANHG